MIDWRSPARSVRGALFTGDLRGSSQSVGAKLLVVPIVAVSGVFGARLAVNGLGVDGYAIFALISGLSALLPFSDLGIGAAVMDAVARREALGQNRVEDILVTSWRFLTLGGVLVATFSWIAADARIWSPLLGTRQSSSIELAAAIAVSVFALSLPLSLGPRLLTGEGRNHLAILIQASAPLTTLALLFGANASKAPLWAYTASPFAGIASSNMIALGVSARTTHIRLGRTFVRALRPSVRGGRVRHIAGPMVVITVILPIAYQSDRLVLSHVSSLGQVAAYSVAFQLFAPLMGVVGSAGMALWPVFAHQRDGRGTGHKSFVRVQISFGLLGLLLAIGLLSLGPYLARFVGGNVIHVRVGLLGAFAALLVIQAVSYPMAMLLTDGRGLRFQALLHIAMLAINLPLSIVLARMLGAKGPVLGSFIAIAIALFVPQFYRVRRLTARSDLKLDISDSAPHISV
jgi:O-antigen/teichoic acid export membrane protein